MLEGYNDCYVIIFVVFRPFIRCFMTYSTVWCTCRAFLSTEGADADAVKPHTGEVSFEFATSAR